MGIKCSSNFVVDHGDKRTRERESERVREREGEREREREGERERDEPTDIQLT